MSNVDCRVYCRQSHLVAAKTRLDWRQPGVIPDQLATSLCLPPAHYYGFSTLDSLT
ncbi:hypothetical protein SK128_028076, partial [Halocaridina rubra]